MDNKEKSPLKLTLKESHKKIARLQETLAIETTKSAIYKWGLRIIALAALIFSI